jgi:para-aminobenzoate synthetase component 1
VISVQRIATPPTATASRFALHSAGTSPWDRWSYDLGAPSQIITCDAATLVTTLREARGEVRQWADPLDALAWLGQQATEATSDGPPFKGGWVGYVSYDLGRLFETLPTSAIDDLHLPLFTFTHHHDVVAFDRFESAAYRCVDETLAGRPAIELPPRYVESRSEPRPDVPREAYERAVRRAIHYIAAGDVFQVNLAQRFSAGLPCDPRALYERLRARHPARFGAFLDFGDHALLSNSPELFLRVTPQPDGSRHVLTRPIKGTRPRLPGMDDQLHRSIKDQAELNMIVDLERNDLGRICQIGSVRVTEPRRIEAHPTVYHGAATIEGMLRSDVTFVDLLRATFPGGSITGAPKIRAMEIIDELEPTRRGPYCGAIGYLSADGHVQFNIAIRTMIATPDRIYFSVGGGVVADSDPAAEYEETLVKARAMLQAIRGTTDERR